MTPQLERRIAELGAMTEEEREAVRAEAWSRIEAVHELDVDAMSDEELSSIVAAVRADVAIAAAYRR